MENTDVTDIRQLFVNLIGEDKIKFIENQNWVKYKRKPFYHFKSNEISINFFRTDGKGDNVIFFSICYGLDDEKWFSENCIDYPDIAFDTYEEMRDHVTSIEDRIINNGFQLAKLP